MPNPVTLASFAEVCAKIQANFGQEKVFSKTALPRSTRYAKGKSRFSPLFWDHDPD